MPVFGTLPWPTSPTLSSRRVGHRLSTSPCDPDQRPTVTEIGWACRSIKVRLPSDLASVTRAVRV